MKGNGTRERWIALLGATSLAALGAMSALALDRTIEGGTVLRAGIAASLGAHAIGNFPRRWGRTSLVVASGLGLFMLLAVAAEGPTTWHGVPTSTTFRSLAHDALDGIREVRVAVPRADPTPGLLILALSSVWLLSLASSLMRARWDAPLQALAPPWALVIVTAILGEGPRRAELTVALLVASLAVVLIEDFRSSVSQYAGSRPRVRATWRSSALPLLVVAPIAGLLGSRLIAPTSTSSGLLPDPGGDRVVVSPLVDIRSRLRDPGDARVFTVRSPVAANWRLTALDDFDGSIWSAKDRYRETGGRLPAEDAPGVRSESASATRVRQVFHIDALSGIWLPAAYRPISIALDGVRVSASTSSLVADRPSPRGLTYEVTSAVPAPGHRSTASPGAIPASVLAQLELPRGFPGEVVRIAEKATESASSPLHKAQLLEQHLRGSFTYDQDVPPGHSADDLTEFLTVTRRGYCEQFAGAFAAMARAVGLPSRVAVGFTPGQLDPTTNTFLVTEQDAHAWPEVYLPDVGWTAFEPTPGRDLATTASNAGGGAADPSSGREDDGRRGQDGDPRRPGEANKSRAQGDSGTDDSGRISWIPISVALLALLVVAGLFVPVRKRARRRERMAERDTTENITGAWREAASLLAEWGYTPSPSATPLEVARDAPVAGDALVQLAELYTAAGYAPAAPTRDEARSAWEAVAVLERSLDQEDSPAGRIRRRLDPRTLSRP